MINRKVFQFLERYQSAKSYCHWRACQTSTELLQRIRPDFDAPTLIGQGLPILPVSVLGI
ncbi:hypothetical protein ACTXT7_013885 [Hymenolepis weldensis]